ncbi:ankyrin repeat domain-containing protein 2-like [Bufo gargarizans]|uniref:ankyrin repeat domain-containing protein 2-like n=1 Tax=Bufo gargarizans TaxID=30331 RepID=UPI001CF32B0D|nr:ankyrin repeat domain-containing protein 2-like [Bufo gargarizans]
MEDSVKWATDIIDQKLELEQENEIMKPRFRKIGLIDIDQSEFSEEKFKPPINKNLANLQGEERIRKTSVDLRKEIVDVGGIQNLIEIRKRRQERKKKKSQVVAPEPKPEIEGITEPISPDRFLKAAVEGKMNIIEKFLEDAGSPDTCDEFKRTALHRASLEGHIEIIKKLIDSGSSVNFRDRLDSTAVHWACRGGKLEVVKLLQDNGAEINVKDKVFSTPLHVATRTGRADIVEHLIATGVDINAKDREGDTALHDAVRLNRYKIIKMLIIYGANMMTKNADGKTPTDLVQQWQSDTREALVKQTNLGSEKQL